RLHDTEYADAVSVFALRESAQIGVWRTSKSAGHVWRNERVVRRLKLVIFGAYHERKCDAVSAWPSQGRPQRDRVVVAVRARVLVHRRAPDHVAMRSMTAS